MKKIIDFISNIPKDKILHAYVGTIICVLSTVLFNLLPLSWNEIICFSLAIVTIIGCGKEVYDSYNKGSVESYDIIATVCGGIIGIIITLPIFL